MHPEHGGTRHVTADPAGRRLDSWKEIAAYIGRDVRTAQRWETRDGLPVHRLHHAKLGSVFAYTTELDAWRDDRDRRVSDISGQRHQEITEDEPPALPDRARLVSLLPAAAVALVLVTAGMLVWGESAPRGAVATRSPVARRVAPDAYERYLRARFVLSKPNPTGRDWSESVRLFEESIARDEWYAPAHAGLAAAYQELGATGAGILPVVNTISKSLAAARRALELDGQMSEALATLASAEQQAWHWAESERAYRRALDINPHDVNSRFGLAGLLIHQGYTAEGAALARAARDLDAHSTRSTVRLGWLLYHARQYDAAARELRAVVDAQPANGGALWILGFVLIELREFDEAIAVLERAAHVSNRNGSDLGVLARAYGRAGRLEDAWQIIGELEERARAGYVPPAVFVNAYMGVSDYDAAFAALDRAYREHSNVVLSLKSHPLYDPIRTDPRFLHLLRKVGLGGRE
jgi:tetratricopeptide (TPR) repeat protein